MRKIKYAMYILFNLIRLPIKKILSGGRFRCPVIQLISPGCDIEVIDNGKLNITGRIHTEKNTLLSVAKGDLECGGFFLNRNSMIVCRKKITIGSGTTIGPNTIIYDHDHDLENRGQLKTSPVSIGKRVWIGAGCTILKGVTIGDNSVIAAGTVVTKDVPANSLIRSHITYVTKEIG